ncbi:MAG: 5-(carboxyamino)imidazole ribonucleotide synthase [Verrucomicrobiota bacterium]
MSKHKAFLPGTRIGIFGGGQLGRMMIIAGRPMGYHFHVFDPSEDCTAGRLADAHTAAAYTDSEALIAFAKSVDVVTLEFENIDAAAVETVAKNRPVFPKADILRTCQNRSREKKFLSGIEVPVAPYAVAKSADAMAKCIEKVGTPCVVKSAESGYDGKGQIKLTEFKAKDKKKIWESVGGSEVVVEKWIEHTGEFSCICARRSDGTSRMFPMARNAHRNHILAESTVPCGLPSQIEAEGQRITRRIAEELDVVGLITVEFFLAPDNTLLVNELAPRPHNSGHYTIDACITSQFEQHLRAVCGLPLGDPSMHTPAKMINLLGDRWAEKDPDWEELLKDPKAKLHLYDKGEPRPGRKMGHLTLLEA